MLPHRHETDTAEFLDALNEIVPGVNLGIIQAAASGVVAARNICKG